MLKAQLSHVAFLVTSVEKSAKITASYGFENGPAENWEGEGTLEVYVGSSEKAGRLLLMQAVKDGAYQRAFQKRGPGLHHIAIDVPNLEEYILQLSGSGWLLHPQSLKTIKDCKTAYLARPGIPTLIEVQERTLPEKPLFIDRIEVSVPNSLENTLHALGVTQIQPSRDQQTWVTCGGKRLYSANFIGIFSNT